MVSDVREKNSTRAQGADALDRPRAEVDEAAVAVPAGSGVCRAKATSVSSSAGQGDPEAWEGRTARDEAVALGKLATDVDVPVAGLEQHAHALGGANVAEDGPDAVGRVELLKLLAVLLGGLGRGRHLDRRVVLSGRDLARRVRRVQEQVARRRLVGRVLVTGVGRRVQRSAEAERTRVAAVDARRARSRRRVRPADRRLLGLQAGGAAGLARRGVGARRRAAARARRLGPRWRREQVEVGLGRRRQREALQEDLEVVLCEGRGAGSSG